MLLDWLRVELLSSCNMHVTGALKLYLMSSPTSFVSLFHQSLPSVACHIASESTYLDTALRRTRVFQRIRAPVLRPTTLSVERRFAPTQDSLACLVSNDSDVPFLKHDFLGRHVIKDFYILDHMKEEYMKDEQRSQRYLLRVRNGKFEAKIETLGIGKGNTYANVYGEKSVKRLFRSTPSNDSWRDGLDPFGWMRTIRKGWELDGFKVAIDHTLFGSWLWGKAIYPQKPFRIGKVELVKPWSATKTKKLDAQDMDRKIDEFLNQHQRIFPGSGAAIDGKVEAFNKWMKRHIEKMCREVKTTDEWQMKGYYSD
jgi:hypothetical protein